MRNARTAVLVVSVAALALTMPSPAAAKVTETWRVAINMPESLSIDAGGIFSITPDKQKLKVNGRKRTGRWQNFTISYPTLSQALKQTREGPAAGRSAVDRPLTRKQSKKLSQRLLWIDADVLLVSADNPVCQTGVTSAQIQQMLSGGTRDWQQIAAPAHGPQGALRHPRVCPVARRARSCCSECALTGQRLSLGEADAVSAVPRLISAAVVAKYSALGQTRGLRRPGRWHQPERRHGGQRGLSAHATRLLGDQKSSRSMNALCGEPTRSTFSGLSATSSWEPSGSATGCGLADLDISGEFEQGIAHPGRGTPGPGSGLRPTARRDPGCTFGGCLHRGRVGHEVLGGADVDHGAGDRRKVHGLMTLQGTGQMAVPGDIHGQEIAQRLAHDGQIGRGTDRPGGLEKFRGGGQFSQSVDESAQ